MNDIIIYSEIMEYDKFRKYDNAAPRVVEHYLHMRSKQTVEHYDKMAAKYTFNDPNKKMTILDAFHKLESYIDASDPDLEIPNLFHLLQTAEGIRNAGHPEWFQIVGLLHDVGKIMFLWGTDDDGQNGYDHRGQQWSLGGDTFVCGCAIPDQIVFPEFNKLNKDMSNELYNTKYGIYDPYCGLDKLKFSWGHDEYMYRMLVANKALIPYEGLAMVRYHSAYSWHTYNAYEHLCNERDIETKEWVKKFNEFDLYTKNSDNKINIDNIWPYYDALLNKYGLGGQLWW